MEGLAAFDKVVQTRRLPFSDMDRGMILSICGLDTLIFRQRASCFEERSFLLPDTVKMSGGDHSPQ